MNFIHYQKTPNLTAHPDSNNKNFRFRIHPKTYQEIAYFGRIRIASKVNLKPEFNVAHQEYGGHMSRTTDQNILVGSLTQGVCSVGVFYFDSQ